MYTLEDQIKAHIAKLQTKLTGNKELDKAIELEIQKLKKLLDPRS